MPAFSQTPEIFSFSRIFSMLRQPTLAPRLLALALLVVVVAPSRPALGQEPTKGHSTAAEVKEGKFAAAAEPTEPGHEGQAQSDHQSPNIMEVQSPLAIWTVIVFGLLLVILGRFAWRPVIRAMHEREAHLEQVLRDSERARNEAEAIVASHRKQLAGAADEVRALIEQARKEAQVSADSIVKKAQAEAESARERAEREISNARDQALMEIWSKTADLAVSVAGRVLEKELGDSDHRRLVEAALNELPSNGRERGQA